MANASTASLGALRVQSRQRSDMENNFAVTDAEFNQYISQSYKELYDLLVAAYGDDYYVAPYYQFSTSGSQLYPLPDGSGNFLDVNGNTAAAFYKLLGLDLQYSGSPTGWVTLRRVELIERNKFGYPNTASTFTGYTNLVYRIEGSNIFIPPLPMGGQLLRAMYIPAPQNLVYLLSCPLTLGSPTITLSDTTGLTVGMQIYGLGFAPQTTVIGVTSSTVTLSTNALATYASSMIYFWSDATIVNGVSGWEEYIVIDAAIKAQIKQENDFSGLAGQKLAMQKRIEAMANGRDAGQAHHVSDALSINGWGDNDCGYGGGGGYGFF